ncbi:MAG TPA: hypothetical protein VGQ59_08550 [Cyclobacteriaceae bacterium]|nr:hypothetical protein [Cyclobacteriaceae bacterium]
MRLFIQKSVIIQALVLAPIFLSAQVEIVSSTSSNKIHRISINHNGVSNFSVETRGKIELTDDDKDIKSISPDGYLEITKVTFGSKRSIKITPTEKGIRREYYEGREKIDFETEGRKWLGEILPELVRSTTIGAESRVNRFFKQGGTTAVLNELDEIESDHVKTAYANLLMKQNVAAKDYPSIISKVTSEVSSDHYRTEFLTGSMNKFLSSKEAMDAVFVACGKMDSDHYKTQVIKEALEKQTPTVEGIKSIMLATTKMESDHYKTEVLTTLLDKDNLSDGVISEMINATKSMDSDHYRTQVLTKAVTKKGLSSVSFQRVLESVKEMNSDHYKTQVITELLNSKLNNELITLAVDLSHSISSDHYKAEVLTTMLKKQELTDDGFKKLVLEGSQTNSDHYATEVLTTALQIPNLTNARIMAVLNAVTNINSDHYVTEVLTRAAPKVRNDASLKDAYRAAAKKINSTTYYGQALRAID